MGYNKITINHMIMRNQSYKIIAWTLSLVFCLPLVAGAHAGDESDTADHAEQTTPTVNRAIEKTLERVTDKVLERPGTNATEAKQMSEREKATPDRTQAQEDRASQKDERAEERTEERDLRREHKLRMLRKSMAVHINRMQAAINRLQNIIDRLTGALRRINERGIETSAVAALIEEAQAQKAEAVSLLEDAKAKYAAIETSEDPKAAMAEFTASLRGVKEQLKDLHQTLIEAMRTLKGLVKSPEEPNP